MSEQVLVVPREALFPGGRAAWSGFEEGAAEGYLRAVADAGFFAPRESVEGDPGLKQIIPYAMVVSGDQVLVLRRSRRGGEPRLHEMVSLGVGGHVNPIDLPGGDRRSAVAAAFRRELAEELVVEGPHQAEVIGVLNDDSNAVGQVHFGIVYRVTLPAPQVRVREAEALSGEFVPAHRVASFGPAMETWSRILQVHFWPG